MTNLDSAPSPHSPASSPHGSVHHQLEEKISTIPLRCRFLLDPKVNYNDLTTSRPRLIEMMKHFDVPPPKSKSASKPEVVTYYKTHLLPIIQPFIRMPNVPSPPSSTQSSDIQSTSGPMNVSESPSHMTNLDSLINTDLKSTTKPLLYETLSRHHLRSMVLLTMAKKDLVKLYHRYIRNNPLPPPTHFQLRPHASSIEEMRGKDRDQIRHAIQCYCPHIFIPSLVCNTPILLKLYEAFVLESVSAHEALCEGVHYHRIEPTEIIVDPHMTF